MGLSLVLFLEFSPVPTTITNIVLSFRHWSPHQRSHPAGPRARENLEGSPLNGIHAVRFSCGKNCGTLEDLIQRLIMKRMKALRKRIEWRFFRRMWIFEGRNLIITLEAVISINISTVLHFSRVVAKNIVACRKMSLYARNRSVLPLAPGWCCSLYKQNGNERRYLRFLMRIYMLQSCCYSQANKARFTLGVLTTLHFNQIPKVLQMGSSGKEILFLECFPILCGKKLLTKFCAKIDPSDHWTKYKIRNIFGPHKEMIRFLNSSGFLGIK